MRLVKTHFKSQGFTVFELVIVTIILVILSSVVIAILPSMTDGSKQSATVSNMRSIASAMSLYRADFNAYPVADTPESLAVILEPDYISKMVQSDGWGKPFFVDSKATSYTIGTGGKGWDGSSALNPTPQGPTYTYESDIILTDGVFTQFPDRES